MSLINLSIIIPAYNSASRLPHLISALKKLSIKNIGIEIIVVDDASKDNTYDVLKKITNIKLLHHIKNTGKGGAVKSGLHVATGDILLIQDDDMEYDPGDIPSLISPIITNEADVVFGSRRLNKNNKYVSPSYNIGASIVNNIIKIIIGKNLTDPITGYKAFTREVYKKIQPIESKGFEIEAELTTKMSRKGFKIVEVPISYSPRSVKEGKNIRWHQAFPIIGSALKYRLG